NSILKVPAEMQVDWVHVYSSSSSALAVTPEANYTGPGGSGGAIVDPPPPPPTDTITGTSGNDKLSGTTIADTMLGLTGNDILRGGDGNDTLNGGDGNDWLNGGFGADILTGGLGADTFIFRNIAASPSGSGTYDTITDFSHAQGDRIALDTIDANPSVSGDQAFNFIGANAFTNHAGELRYQTTSTGLMVYGDINGDGVADLAIALTGVSSITTADFIL
ncbi:MAG: hypothetical protein HY245_05705, partial [Rhizobiales bacterium]|nr:hypothetical protein [Hyphomicrobiales bacterium]